MSYDFHVGMQVVCIRAASGLPPGFTETIKGCVYTIRAVHPPGFLADEVGLCFENIVNPRHPVCGEEYRYRASNYRPVKRTSIEVFEKLLNPTEREVVAATSEPVAVPCLAARRPRSSGGEPHFSHSPVDHLHARRVSVSVIATEHGAAGHGIH